MAIHYLVLGQAAPAATTLTTLYTVPAATQAIGSTLCACNRSTSTTIRVAVRPAGASITNSQYLLYDVPLAANASTFLTMGMSLATTDVVSVYAGSANVSFTLFGTELS